MIKVAWRPEYILPLPPQHRFPMEKYALIPEQLIYDGTLTPEHFFAPQAMEEKHVLLTHTQEYWNRLKSLNLTPQEVRKNGFPLSPELVERELFINQGTLDCFQFAIESGVALNVAGGTHHAYAHAGEGFCILNDFACAFNVLLAEKKIKQGLIIDLDVHQGNGTAALFKGNSKVFTFSMHGENNYPLKKEISDLDIPLPDQIQDAEYLKILSSTLPTLIDRIKPDFIAYLAGVDVLATDKLGRLGLSKQGCLERDYCVLSIAHKSNIPLAIAMGGGYSPEIKDIVNAHCNTFRIARDLWN
ncbi:MAG: histone deacetylase [Sphingobacteriia bacterium]|nr:histone deacetylase [Sphingobacteriia bacterium]